jgi:two-component system NtrC family sensor kinase
VPVQTVLERVLRLLEHRVDKEKLEIEQDLAEPLPSVNTRGTGLQQVLMNLLTNAFDGVAAGTRKRIRIRVRAHGDGVLIRIADSGIGIPPAQLSRIYDPFFSTKAEGKGTGLGLSVSMGIVEAAGGRLECVSTSPTGTVFDLWWPSRPDPGALPQNGGSAAQPGGGATGPGDGGNRVSES